MKEHKQTRTLGEPEREHRSTSSIMGESPSVVAEVGEGKRVESYQLSGLTERGLSERKKGTRL